MKVLNITFEDKDYNILKRIKGKMKWRDFIIQSAKKMEDKDDNKK